MEEKENNQQYAIPANYSDSGRLFGGMLSARNVVEAVITVIIIGFIEIKLIPISTTIRIVVMVLTIMPTAIAAMMGIDGESLTQYLGHIFCFFKNRRRLHYRRVKSEDENK